MEASDEQLASGKIPGQKPLKTLYELNDTLFAEAEVEEDGQVGLWLGVSVLSGRHPVRRGRVLMRK